MIEMQRDFIPGSEWLYYKVYTGAKTADQVLTEALNPIIAQLLEKQCIDHWFFIRYGDPENHLRIRFHCPKPENIGYVIQALHPALNDYVQNDLIWKIQADTYQREIERYGEETMIEAEQYFFHDSKMIVDFLGMIEGHEGEVLRWLFGIRAMDAVLEDFEFAEDKKIQFTETLSRGFMKEFNIQKPAKLQLDKKFRNEFDNIKWMLSMDSSQSNEYTPIIQLIEQKSQAVSEICRLIKSETNETRLNGMVSSYIHMLINRLFRSKNRDHELVLYYLLHKTYKAERGRKKHFK